MLKKRIGFIGAGQMATALAQGWIRKGLVSPENVLASDPLPEARTRFEQATAARTADKNQEVATASGVLVLAVKPQHMAPVLKQLPQFIAAETLVVSIAAGIRIATMSEKLGASVRLIRVMPNTPCLLGQGAFGYCANEAAGEEDIRLVEQLLGAVGIAHRVEEKLMDAVTGLSGSGPAFVYVLIESMADAGVKMGLPRLVALSLAAQTVRGAAEMVLSSGEHPAVLKDRVASPGGTTITGLAALEAGGLRAAMIAAVETATHRSAELGAS